MARGVTVFVVVAALIVAPLSVPAPRAHACSCMMRELNELVARADLITVGRVLEITYDSPETFPVDLSFEVQEYLKGSGPNRIMIRDASGLQGEACSAFDWRPVGKTYLLFLAAREDGHLGTSRCDGSGPVTGATQEQVDRQVRQVRRLVPDPSSVGLQLAEDEAASRELPWVTITGAFAAAALVAGLAVILWRSVRR